ncbi:hypothetical protein FJTKL_11248 [Diaporthe vaccinii]|uniref:Uncharacterized protein n=1 Tax=Diaporthe vaccinii TaxID=105482 RepID=A0ABR4EHR3_9PEZI
MLSKLTGAHRREIAARVRVDEPLAPAPRVAGAQRATPCLPCVRSALGGRSAGSCFDVAGAPRANRCLLCSSGHKCLRLPSAVRAAARELVSLLEAEAPKKEIARARSTVRRIRIQYTKWAGIKSIQHHEVSGLWAVDEWPYRSGVYHLH